MNYRIHLIWGFQDRWDRIDGLYYQVFIRGIYGLHNRPGRYNMSFRTKIYWSTYGAEYGYDVDYLWKAYRDLVWK